MAMESQRRPGLGAVLASVYGVTTETIEIRVPRIQPGLLPRAAQAIKAKVRQRSTGKK
jgi:hypothetical protein